MEQNPATGRKLFWIIAAQSLAIALVGAAVWWLVSLCGGSRDASWTLAAIVWVIGSPIIELFKSVRGAKPSVT
jgi:hypothetical protein